MKTLCVFFALLVFVSMGWAFDKDQIISVSSTDSVRYVFAQNRDTVNLSAMPNADYKYFCKAFWAVPLRGDLKAVKVLTASVVERSAMLGQLNLFGITPDGSEQIELSAQAKADVLASQIVPKAKIIKFLENATLLRKDNPTWTDKTIQAMSKP